VSDQQEPKPFEAFSDQRETLRAPIRLVCDVRQGTAPWRKLALEDLSAGGFSIARFGPADPMQPVRIRIPGLQVLSAKVSWQRGEAIGCSFLNPLHPAVFDHIRQSENL